MLTRRTKTVAALSCTVIALGYMLFGATRMREHYAGSTCAANLRSIGVGLALYAQDYDQTLPFASVWMDRTQRYLPGDAHSTQYFFRCPAVHQGPEAYGCAFNRLLSGEHVPREAGSALLVFDSQNTQWNAAGDPTEFAMPSRHEQGWPHPYNNFLFADGHVR